MKLCKDCKHLVPNTRDITNGLCGAPQNMMANVVSGEQVIGKSGNRFAENVRLVGGCGVGAKWFEPTSPLAAVCSREVASPARRPWWKFWA